jgi:Cys-tRNA(Pro) deacylase
VQEQPPVAQALTALHIPHTVFTHNGPVSSLEQAAVERGQQPNQVVRSLLFRLAEGDFAMVLMAGPAQVSWKALRKHFGQSRLTTATEEEVLAVTGYVRGAVAPFGVRQPVRVLMDEGVLQQAVVSLGSGLRGTAVILTTADLQRALPDAEIGNFHGE